MKKKKKNHLQYYYEVNEKIVPNLIGILFEWGMKIINNKIHMLHGIGTETGF